MQALDMWCRSLNLRLCGNIKECLRIQPLKRKGMLNKKPQSNVIEECLEMLGKNQLHLIAKKLRVILRTLNELKKKNFY